jgi:hypothetical protein
MLGEMREIVGSWSTYLRDGVHCSIEYRDCVGGNGVVDVGLFATKNLVRSECVHAQWTKVIDRRSHGSTVVVSNESSS